MSADRVAICRVARESAARPQPLYILSIRSLAAAQRDTRRRAAVREIHESRSPGGMGIAAERYRVPGTINHPRDKEVGTVRGIIVGFLRSVGAVGGCCDESLFGMVFIILF